MPQTKIKIEKDAEDVNITTPNEGDLLHFDTASGKWINDAPVAGATALDDLTDVDVPAPDDGDVLTYDDGSGNWVSQPPSSGGHTIENNEVALTQRTKLDFKSPLVATDDAGNDRTEVALDVATGAVMYGKVLLFDQTLSAAGTFDFQNIPQDYDHLEVVATLRGTVAATYDQARMYLNNDTTANNYDQIVMYGGSASGGGETNNEPRMEFITAASSDAGQFSTLLISIPEYRNTAVRKTTTWSSNSLRTIGSAVYVERGSTVWKSQAAINRIAFTTDNAPTDQFVAGSRLQVFGMKNMVTPVGQSSAFVGTQLFKQTLTVAQASFDFQNILAGYDRIEIHISGKSSNNGDDYAKIAFNGDTTDANYRFNQGTHGTSNGGQTGSNRFIGEMPGPTYHSQINAIINNPTETSIYRNVISQSETIAAGGNWVMQFGVTWMSTAAINRITLTLNSGGNFDVDTTCLIVGYKNTLISTPGAVLAALNIMASRSFV